MAQQQQQSILFLSVRNLFQVNQGTKMVSCSTNMKATLTLL
jgi:hypothetical protein